MSNIFSEFPVPLHYGLAALPFMLVVMYNRYWNTVKDRVRSVHGPPDSPLIGNIGIFFDCKDFSEANHKIYRLFDKYGSIFKLWMGHELWVCTSDPQFIEEITATGKTYDSVPAIDFFETFKENAFVHKGLVGSKAYDVIWHPRTKSLSIADASDKLITTMKANIMKGCSLLDIKKCIENSIESIFLGTHWHVKLQPHFNKKISTSMQDKWDISVAKGLNRLQIFGLRFVPEVPGIELNALFEGKGKNKHHSTGKTNLSTNNVTVEFLSVADEKFKDNLVKELSSRLHKAAEITSNFIISLLHNIAANEDIMNKITEEIRTQLNGDKANDLILNHKCKMEYTEMVLKEGLRLYSPPGVIRRLAERVILEKSEITLPKNSLIFISAYYLHRFHDYFEKPCTFYPEHFLPEKEKERTSNTYFPLQLEPLSCTDKTFMLNIVKLILAKILLNFSVETKTKPEQIQHSYFVLEEDKCDIDLSFKPLCT